MIFDHTSEALNYNHLHLHYIILYKTIYYDPPTMASSSQVFAHIVFVTYIVYIIHTLIFFIWAFL